LVICGACTIRAESAARREDNLYQQLDALDEEMQAVNEQLAALPRPEEKRAYLEELLSFDVTAVSDDQKHALNRVLLNLGFRMLCEGNDVVVIAY
jgi:hypothetical protein